MSRHLCTLLTGAILLLTVAVAARARAQDSSLEWAVKATYLYKFAPFVDWPPEAFRSPTSPLAICVAGDPAFGDVVARAAAGEQVAGHPIAVRRLAAGAASSDCHILYAAGPIAAETLATVRGKPVLTVTDETAPDTARGVVQLVRDQGRVRFQIDLGLARQQALEISSRLLELASRVFGANR